MKYKFYKKINSYSQKNSKLNISYQNEAYSNLYRDI